MTDNDMERLISRYLDGTESPEEMAQLDERVRNDPDVCLALFRLATQDATIQTTLAEDSIAGEHVRAEDALRAKPALGWFWIAAAAAAAVALLGAWRLAMPPAVDAVPVAGVVAETRGSFSDRTGSAPLKAGDVLRPGDRLHIGPDGYLKYACRDGTVVEARANSTLTLIVDARSSADSIRLEQGVLIANVRKRPESRRMLLSTPHAVATVKGTVLRLSVTPEYSELNVQTGKVEFATASKRASVVASESATVQGGKLCKFMGQGTPVPDAGGWTEGRVLFHESFEGGFGNWMLYTKVGASNGVQTTAEQCPDIHMARVVREGVEKPVASLTGSAPGGKRVGIVMKQTVSAEGASLSYDYTCEGRPRRAMEGIEIDRFRPPSAVSLGDKMTALARPPGEWNTVRWEITPAADVDGNRYADVKLFFNGERIGWRCEYSDMAATSPLPFQLVLEVIEGRFFFDNVTIRELKKGGDRL